MADMLIDCDIHPALPGSAALLPYLDDHWKEQVTTRGIDGLDLQSYLPSMPISGRPDWRRGTEKPGSDFAMLQKQALDSNSYHAEGALAEGWQESVRATHALRRARQLWHQPCGREHLLALCAGGARRGRHEVLRAQGD